MPAWLCGIVRRIAANVRRKRRWEMTGTDAAETTPSGPTPLDRLEARDNEQIVARALDRLAKKYREPIVLFYRSEQSIKEVATALGISEQAAKQRLTRGRKALAENISRVDGALRASRPGPAFTGAVVAAYAGSRANAARAAWGSTNAKGAGFLAHK